jgi:hypothetical protein
MNSGSLVKFSGVIVEHDDPLETYPYGKESWRFHLEKRNYPQVASDQLVLSTKVNRVPGSPIYADISLRSPRIAKELTEPYTKGELANNEFPIRLLDILSKGNVQVEKALYSGAHENAGKTQDFDGWYSNDASRKLLQFFLPSIADALRQIIEEQRSVLDLPSKGLRRLFHYMGPNSSKYKENSLSISGQADVVLKPADL